MGGAGSIHSAMPQTTVPEGKIRICVAGYNYSPFTGRAHLLANTLAKTYPNQVETWFYWDNNGGYYRYLLDTFDKVPFRKAIKGHGSSPFVWIEVAKSEASKYSAATAAEVNAIDGDNAVLEAIGGCDRFQAWVKAHTEKAAGGGAFDASGVSPLDEEEQKANVSVTPATTLFFKENAEVSQWWDSWKWSDISHVAKFGPQTAAQK